MDFLIDIITDAWKDTWLMIPLLYCAYLVVEYFERRPSNDDGIFWKLQKYGPLFGALLGLLPQCGFSILAAMLFLQNNITIGTVIAVFISTSDEAIPILISEPSMIPSLLVLLACKFVLGAACGWFTDRVLFPHQKILLFSEMPEEEEEDDEQTAENADATCPCCYPQYPMWLSALIRTAKIYLFVFLTTVVLNGLIASVPEEMLSSILMTNSVFQPAAAALFGFIPNCAATVVLCQLYASSMLSFGSLLAGLMTNAGMGLLVLFRYEPDRKKIWKITGLLFLYAVLAGYLVQCLELLL